MRHLWKQLAVRHLQSGIILDKNRSVWRAQQPLLRFQSAAFINKNFYVFDNKTNGIVSEKAQESLAINTGNGWIGKTERPVNAVGEAFKCMV